MTVADYLELPYTIVLKRDEEGDWMATIAELDGCLAYGSDVAEATSRLKEVQRGWIELALEAGQDIPLPQSDEDLPSGKLLLRFPRHLHKKLILAAKAEGVSLNTFLIACLAEYLPSRRYRADDRVIIEYMRKFNQEVRTTAWEEGRTGGNRSPSVTSEHTTIQLVKTNG